MLLLAIITFLRFPLSWPLKTSQKLEPPPARRLAPRILLITLLLLAGLTGFFVRYSAFFKKGATSVSARFDYWRAAIQVTKSHPLFGTGPGTFQIPYEQIKRPDAEMSRLVHNDYLQQASHSGLPGFLLYTTFIVSALTLGLRSVLTSSPLSPRPPLSPHFAIWLGLFGWAAQCLVEFSLQMPALAWPAFTLL